MSQPYEGFDPYDTGYKEGYAQAQKDAADEAEADQRANTCDQMGCNEAVTCGWGPSHDRRRTCGPHSKWVKESKIEWTPPESKL